MRTPWLLPFLALACSKPVPGSSPPNVAPENASAPAPAAAPPAPASTAQATATAAQPTAPAPARAAATAPATAAPNAAPSIDPGTVPAGTYRNASCGARTYARVVRLSAPNVIEMEDLVSPCPPGARCIWSGVVVRTGTYTVEGARSLGKPMRVVIRMTPGADARSQPPPTHLLWWNSRGDLTEADDKCRYTIAP